MATSQGGSAPASNRKKADPTSVINRLLESVRNFWMSNESKFMSVWKVLEPEGKRKFASACAGACAQMTPQAAALMPEISEELFCADPSHVSELFWYMYSEDGEERDQDFVQMGLVTGQLEGPQEQLVALRRVGILTCLNRLVDVYESIWSKGVQGKKLDEDTEEYRDRLELQAASLANNTCINCQKPGTNVCARCKKVRYCGRPCQVAHWKGIHKKWCFPAGKGPKVLTKKEQLKKKLEAAKKLAKGKADAIGPRIRSR